MWTFVSSKNATGVRNEDNSMGKGFPFNIIDECRDIRTFLTQVQNEFDVVTDYYPLFWKFIEKNGRLPRTSVKEECLLYQWCGKVWRNDWGLADKFSEVYAKLKEMRFGETVDLQTERRVQEFFEFIKTHGRLPKSSVKEENNLYQWCGEVWRNKRGLAERCPEVLAKLKEMKFGEGTNMRTEKMVDEFWKFVNAHGRMPKKSVKEEKSLCEWCGRMRRNISGLADRYPEVLAKIKEMGFGENTDIKTERRVKEFFEFVNIYGRLPKFSIKEEKSLYNWCGFVWRNQYGLTERFPDVYAKLKEMKFGEWADIKREKRVKEFFEFVNTHGRLPKFSVKEEKSLWSWCGKVWGNKSGLAEKFPEVLAKLKEMRYGEGNDLQTEKRVKEFFEFVSAQGRLPMSSVKKERKLYWWCRDVWRNVRGLAERCPEVLAKIKELKGQK